MDDRVDGDIAYDKQWAAKYILGPLYEPEPSQVCATHFTPLPSTPPASANPPRRRLSHRDRRKPAEEDDEEQPFLRRLLSRSNSVNSRHDKPLPPPPPRSKYPPISGLERKRSLHTAYPPQTRWNQGTILSRSNSEATSRPSADRPRPSSAAAASSASLDRPRRRAGSLAEPSFADPRAHRPHNMSTQERRAATGGDTLPRRSASLRERYPGDMSHRPLDMLKRDHRAADRAPHLHNPGRQQPSDPIDVLDSTGPVPGARYHHEGPFDAAMKQRNANKTLAPVEAVRDTNMEALKATPPEFVQDSLVKHVPLQGTAVVPPGMQDLSGRTMEYSEGADLMRESDAEGGPYRRWEHVRYRDDDLKGKGEPAFSLDQARRDAKRDHGKQKAAHRDGPVYYYEMQPAASAPGSSGPRKEAGVRQRSLSSSDSGFHAIPAEPGDAAAGSSGVRRSSTTGKSIAQSLRRRLGSLRRRKGTGGVGY